MVSTHDEGPRWRQRGPSADLPNSTSHALQNVDSCAQDNARLLRIAAIRGVGAAYHHLRIRRLVSTVVVAESQCRKRPFGPGRTAA